LNINCFRRIPCGLLVKTLDSRKMVSSNLVLGKCFWAKRFGRWGTHHSRRKLWILNPLMSRSIIAYNWLVSWHVWGVRIRTGKTLGLGKASLIGARRHSNVSSVKNQNQNYCNIHVCSSSHLLNASVKLQCFLVFVANFCLVHTLILDRQLSKMTNVCSECALWHSI